MKYRIVKDKYDIYSIQSLNKKWFSSPKWETVGDADWAAVYADLDDAKRQLAAWRGIDVDADRVVYEE